MSKDYGNTSGYTDPSNRSWEQVTWFPNSYPQDSELNLLTDLRSASYSHRSQCSGFRFSHDLYAPGLFPVDTSGYVDEPGCYRSALPAGSAVANTLYIGPRQVAVIDGMEVQIAGASEDWVAVDLGTAPTGVGVKRWDFVFLEVWRALVTGDATTDTSNNVRDSNGKIFFNGWVDSPTADNITDDVLAIATETSRRVQVQWRLRVVQDVDYGSTFEPLDDTSVFAQGPAGSVSAINFTSQSGSGDAGLWVSSGHSETVDGNIYAVPVCVVARRNQSAWAKDTNQNGGSSRPDGLSYEDIVERDIVDLRKVSVHGGDLSRILQTHFSWVLDGRLQTSARDHGLGGGEVGTWYYQADEIGPTDTAGATKISEPDGVLHYFSDAEVLQKHIAVIELGDRSTLTSPTEWQEGDEFEIALPASSSGVFVDVVGVTLQSGASSTHLNVTGLNSDTLTVTLPASFESNIASGLRTSVDMYVETYVAYPGNMGLSRTPHFYQKTLVGGASITALASGDTINYETTPAAAVTGFDSSSCVSKPSRTVKLSLNLEYTDFSVYSTSTTTTTLPYDISSVTGIYDAVSDPTKTTNLYVSHSDNVITHSAVASSNRSMLVDFESIEAVPENEQCTVYYRTQSPQTVDMTASGLNLASLKVVPVLMGSYVYVSSAGSGSPLAGYPWVTPLGQIPCSDSTLGVGDHLLNDDQPLSVDDFATSVQSLQLPVHVPMAHVPYLEFITPAKDSEDRAYFNEVDNTSYDDEINGSSVAYQPTVVAKQLSTAVPHQVLYPCLAMCLEDTVFAKRGTLIMLVFSRASSDAHNMITFQDISGGDDSSCVGVYRLKGNLIFGTRAHMLGSTLIGV